MLHSALPRLTFKLRGNPHSNSTLNFVFYEDYYEDTTCLEGDLSTPSKTFKPTLQTLWKQKNSAAALTGLQQIPAPTWGQPWTLCHISGWIQNIHGPLSNQPTNTQSSPSPVEENPSVNWSLVGVGPTPSNYLWSGIPVFNQEFRGLSQQKIKLERNEK